MGASAPRGRNAVVGPAGTAGESPPDALLDVAMRQFLRARARRAVEGIMRRARRPAVHGTVQLAASVWRAQYAVSRLAFPWPVAKRDKGPVARRVARLDRTWDLVYRKMSAGDARRTRFGRCARSANVVVKRAGRR